MSRGKRWLLRASIVVVVLVAFFVLEAVTGSLSLYRWDVPLRTRVVDASTGTRIPHATVGYAFSFDEQARYEPVGAVSPAPIIRMTYCRGEGGILGRFKGPAHPVPSMYRFEFAAAGFLPQRIEGATGELIEESRKSWRERFALRIPEVKLERVGR